MQTNDMLVVGAGSAGASAAYEIAHAPAQPQDTGT